MNIEKNTKHAAFQFFEEVINERSDSKTARLACFGDKCRLQNGFLNSQALGSSVWRVLAPGASWASP